MTELVEFTANIIGSIIEGVRPIIVFAVRRVRAILTTTKPRFEESTRGPEKTKTCLLVVRVRLNVLSKTTPNSRYLTLKMDEKPRLNDVAAILKKTKQTKTAVYVCLRNKNAEQYQT